MHCNITTDDTKYNGKDTIEAKLSGPELAGSRGIFRGQRVVLSFVFAFVVVAVVGVVGSSRLVPSFRNLAGSRGICQGQRVVLSFVFAYVPLHFGHTWPGGSGCTPSTVCVLWEEVFAAGPFVCRHDSWRHYCYWHMVCASIAVSGWACSN